ncbi:unnamed protein product [Urochloa humidicola]
MASVVLLLSELLGCESASMLAADRYIMGGRLSSPREFRPAVTAAASPAKQDERRLGKGTGPEQRTNSEESFEFENLAASRIEIDVMWP